MKYNLLSKIDVVGFISNMLAVILGIIITFSIQGVIDRRHEKENVESALSLVREELANCRSDLETCADFFDNEKAAADYIFSHRSDIAGCPEDSLSYYGLFCIQSLILTLPNDALELLKTSSLFSSIDDNELSIKIIRAYDRCNSLNQVFKTQEEYKNEVLEKYYESYSINALINDDGTISMSNLIASVPGRNLITILRSRSGDMLRAEFHDINTAIDGIDDYLNN